MVVTKRVESRSEIHNLIELQSNLQEGQKLEENSTTIGGSQVVTTKVTTPQNPNKPSRVPRTQEVQAPGTNTREE
jgi:hypothetical protein